MKEHKLMLIFVLLFVFFGFALPLLAQDATDASQSTQVPEVVIVPVEDSTAEDVPADEGNWILDVLALLGEGFNSYPGGVLSAAVVILVLQRMTSNPKVVDILERQVENMLNSYPPQTIELLRERGKQVGGALQNLGNVIEEATDGVPLADKKKPQVPAEDVG